MYRLAQLLEELVQELEKNLLVELLKALEVVSLKGVSDEFNFLLNLTKKHFSISAQGIGKGIKETYSG